MSKRIELTWTDAILMVGARDAGPAGFEGEAHHREAVDKLHGHGLVAFTQDMGRDDYRYTLTEHGQQVVRKLFGCEPTTLADDAQAVP